MVVDELGFVFADDRPDDDAKSSPPLSLLCSWSALEFSTGRWRWLMRRDVETAADVGAVAVFFDATVLRFKVFVGAVGFAIGDGISDFPNSFHAPGIESYKWRSKWSMFNGVPSS